MDLCSCRQPACCLRVKPFYAHACDCLWTSAYHGISCGSPGYKNEHYFLLETITVFEEGERAIEVLQEQIEEMEITEPQTDPAEYIGMGYDLLNFASAWHC